MAENYLLKNENKKIKICIGRIFSVFHKNQDKSFFYPAMVSKFSKRKNIDQEILELKGGSSIRDFSNAESIANIIIKLSTKKAQGIFNIGSGEKMTLLEFIKKYINKDIAIKAYGKSNMIVANILKLKKILI